MDAKISEIKKWLGTGSINIFGYPMSGKDTQGVKLAEALGGKLLSSGIIIRANEIEKHKKLTDTGNLIPTNIFYEWVLPYFEREDLKKYPLVLSSIGRWFGEEDTVLETAEKAGHPIKAAVLLNISEADVLDRFHKLQILNDRGERQDDKDLGVFKTRLEEFRLKTMPVLEHYKMMGMLVNVNGDQSREAVFSEMIDKLYEYLQN
ncbi:nucleoside monophosphate kinase [Candidatus Saccharibacteria bacterium]|nr:nucleoside monophosphate kinase [Candidatus Saccharibacteria bacterium]